MVAAPRRGVLFDTLAVSAFTVLAKVMGAAKAVAIARVFGSGAALDSYLLAFLVPSFLADIFCGTLIPALVPRFIEIEHREGRASAIHFYRQILGKSLQFSIPGAAFLAAIGIVLSLLDAKDSFRPDLPLLGVLIALMAPILPLTAMANAWRSVLNARGSFAAPAATAVLTPAVMIACVLLAGRGATVWVLAAGTTLGYGVEIAVLGFVLRRAGFPLTPARPAPSPSMHAVKREYRYLAASTGVSAGAMMIGQSMAATLGAGSISVLNYGTRLAGVLLAIGPAALSITILPRFSQMVAEKDWKTLKSSLRGLLLGSAGIAALVAATLIGFSAPIVRLMLQRGAFTSADTHAVATVQSYSLLQMPFVVGITILMRVVAALKMNRVLLPLSGAALAANTGLNYALMNRFGVSGIALASSIAQAALFLALAALVFYRGNRGFQEGR